MKFICFFVHRLLKYKYRNLVLADDVILCGKIVFGRNNTLNNRVIFVNSVLGDFSYVNYNSIVNVETIGKFCSIGPNCVIGLGNHPTKKFVSTSPYLYTKGIFLDRTYYDEHPPVSIGNDVWIGANVVVVNGIKIGDGAIIAANSVLSEDVPPYSVYGGCPACFIRKRFTDDEIEFLLNFRWWERGMEWIKEHGEFFPDINDLMMSSDFFELKDL